MKNLSKLAVVIVLVLIAIFFVTNKSASIEVSFENNSGESTTDFFLYFPSSTTPQSVPNLEANTTYVTTIKQENSHDESLRLFYHDYLGKKHDIILIDLIKDNNKDRITIDIIDIDESGVYTLDIF